MLTRVEVLSAQGETLVLPLEDYSGGYIIENIDGLDPVKATLVSSEFAGLDGSQYQTSRRENRNIVMKLGLEPDYVNTTVRDLRRNLYRYCMPKTFVSLRFFEDEVLYASISGRVESCEAPQFSQEPEADVSIVCFDPDFVAPSSVVVNGNTTSTTTEQEVSYLGTTETGFLFRLLVNRTLSEFTIYNSPNSGAFETLDFAAPLIAGDVLEISTVAGAKRATLIRSGASSSILYGVSPASSWVNLWPGVNRMRVAAGGAAIPFTIEYTAKYGGL